MLAWEHYDLSTFILEIWKFMNFAIVKVDSLEAFKVRPVNEQGISRQN